MDLEARGDDVAERDHLADVTASRDAQHAVVVPVADQQPAPGFLQRVLDPAGHEEVRCGRMRYRPRADVRDRRRAPTPCDPIEARDYVGLAECGPNKGDEHVRGVADEGDIDRSADAHVGDRRGRPLAKVVTAPVLGSTRRTRPPGPSVTYSALSGPTVLPEPHPPTQPGAAKVASSWTVGPFGGFVAPAVEGMAAITTAATAISTVNARLKPTAIVLSYGTRGERADCWAVTAILWAKRDMEPPGEAIWV